MSSSSSTTQNGSRSPSPHTPDSSDSLEHVAHHDLGLSSWYNTEHDKSAYLQSLWETDPMFHSQPKCEDDNMLQLDDLIESHAYDDSPALSIESPFSIMSPTSPLGAVVECPTPLLVQSLHTAPPVLAMPSNSVSVTKPIPPPASVPRRQDFLLMNHKVVHPPRESCVNLPIMFPSIPESGTKSRVETQVRVTVDLADPSSSSDPYKYDRIGSWKWLKLPQGTATKRRTRKQGKIDPDPQDILHLSVSVTCASPPHNTVLSCSSCRAREAKRVAKKLAARVRPARSDSDSNESPNNTPTKNGQREDTSSIIQFNCSEVIDFSTGSVVLPLRITCYCRHHREKVGFNVHFTMMDHTGRIVGTGSSRPIMITDDHKTSSSKHSDLASTFTTRDYEWAQFGPAHVDSPIESRAPSKRKKDTPSNTTGTKKRAKPYDPASKPSRVSGEIPASSEPSPSPSHATLPSTRSPTPPSLLDPQPPQLQYSSFDSESSPDGLMTPVEHDLDIAMSSATTESDFSVPSPVSLPVTPPALVMPAHPNPMPFMFFDPSQPAPPLALPTIHRLVPNSGPTHGGIEVTILGANFHPSITLNCIFGEVAASSTQRWSDNTLVCVLPPRAVAGVVAVWFEGFPKLEEHSNAPPPLFTYSDESDRALMELALQVVGLKMTGKIEEAKNVAMRIVGNAGDPSDSQNGSNMTGAMQLSPSLTRDLRPLLLIRAGENEDFQSLIIDFLSILDAPVESSEKAISTEAAISHQSSSGQTLLHLAAFLSFPSLVRFLVDHGADLDMRDRNGYTPLHFATSMGSKECVRYLLNAGADTEIVNALGKTAREIAMDGVFAGSPDIDDGLESGIETEEDEEAEWGDAEEDADAIIRRRDRRHGNRRRPRHSDTPRREKDTITDQLSRPPSPSPKSEKAILAGGDEKQYLSFIDLIQKTIAQLPGSPQLPNIHIPGMPAVPWGVLPQLPMVFPVVVPLLPAFLSGDNANRDGLDDDQTDGSLKGKFAGTKAAYELRATWERWLANGAAIKDNEPPPMYTPRVTEAGPSQTPSPTVSESLEEADAPRPEGRSASRIYNYEMMPVTEQEVDAYTYEPKTQPRKQDRMLLLFWLPILIISLIWACHNGLRFALGALRGVVPLKSGMRT
ncbi:hypothetical protein EV421DRAFT_1760988 [Armillaria borealis]|uniref:IPT/TIG domain-containing protein n=1 Tax=Armillaria borealis TaxID=47425 RepID=A0AA39KA80_9AGAR|nr:hypothetical protein EV421DRAFT_1760988 [Armillaria borealis]